MICMTRRNYAAETSVAFVSEAEVAKYIARGWSREREIPPETAAETYESIRRNVARGVKIAPEVVEWWRRKAEQEAA